MQRYVKSLDQDSWLYIDHDKLLDFSIPLHEEKAISYSSSESDHVVSCSYSPDGSRLVTCTTDGFINIWSVHECQIVQSFRGCGTLAAACWWSEGFLIVFCLIEGKAMLSKYPVDEELTIRVAQRKDHALDCTVDKTLKILAFSDGVLIFKLRWNRKIEILDVHEIEDLRWIKLPQIESMECFAVSPGGDSILGVGCEKFRIWKKNDQSPTDYEVRREAYLGSRDVDFYYSNLDNPLCNVNTDGTFGVISLAATLKCYKFCYFNFQDVPYDELGVLFIVVNMDSGDITNYYFDESLGEQDYDEDLRLHTEESDHFNLFASRTFFAVMGPGSLVVFDIKTCEKTASLSAKLLSRSATILPRSVKLLSRSAKLLSRSAKLLSRSAKLLSRSEKLLSRSAKLLSRSAKLLSHSAKLLSRSAKLLSRSAKLLSRSAKLLSRSAKLLSRSAKLLSRSAKLLSRSAKLLSRSAKLLSRSAKLLSHSAKLLSRSATILSRSAKLLSRSAKLLSRSAKLLSRSATILPRSAKLLSRSAKLLSRSAKLLSRSATISPGTFYRATYEGTKGSMLHLDSVPTIESLIVVKLISSPFYACAKLY